MFCSFCLFFSLPNTKWCFIFRLGKLSYAKHIWKWPVGRWRSLLELKLFCKWQCGIFCYHQPFLFLFWELFVVTWTWTLSFTMGVTIYYYLYALFKTETWNGCLFLVSFYFCWKYYFILFFFFCNVGRWSVDRPSSLISVVLVWGLCSVVLGKPLSVFSGSCLHNPVHTPILSLYRKTVNKKKNEIITALVAYLHCVCFTQVCVCVCARVCV